MREPPCNGSKESNSISFPRVRRNDAPDHGLDVIGSHRLTLDLDIPIEQHGGRRVDLDTLAPAFALLERDRRLTARQPGLERNLDVLRTINAERGANLAVGALVVQEGSISEGDIVTIV